MMTGDSVVQASSPKAAVRNPMATPRTTRDRRPRSDQAPRSRDLSQVWLPLWSRSRPAEAHGAQDASAARSETGLGPSLDAPHRRRAAFALPRQSPRRFPSDTAAGQDASPGILRTGR